MLSITVHGFIRGFPRFILSELSLPILSLFFVPLWLIIISGFVAFSFCFMIAFVAYKYMIILEKYLQSLKNKDLKDLENLEQKVEEEGEVSSTKVLLAVDTEMLNTGSEVTFAETQTETETQTEPTTTTEPSEYSSTTTEPTKTEKSDK